MQNSSLVESTLDKNTKQEYLKQAIQDTVNDLSSQSFPIVNATADVHPVIVDKIFEKSSDIVVLETDEIDYSKYEKLVHDHFDGIRSLNFYRPEGVQLSLPDNDKIKIHDITEEAIEQLERQNIRGFIIGDETRYLLEKQSSITSMKRLFAAVSAIFTSKKLSEADRLTKRFETIANFVDTRTAGELTGRINKILHP